MWEELRKIEDTYMCYFIWQIQRGIVDLIGLYFCNIVEL